MEEQPPKLATDAVLVKSEKIPKEVGTVKGYDFNDGVNYHKLLQSYARSGFQASNFGHAVEQINKMVSTEKYSLSKTYFLKLKRIKPLYHVHLKKRSCKNLQLFCMNEIRNINEF